jgi:hypothetical protein
MPSFALRSNIWMAAIFSRGDTMGSSMMVPFCFVITLVELSRTISVRTWIISWTLYSDSRHARSNSPGMKKEHNPAPSPVTISWCLDFSMSPINIPCSPLGGTSPLP